MIWSKISDLRYREEQKFILFLLMGMKAVYYNLEVA